MANQNENSQRIQRTMQLSLANEAVQACVNPQGQSNAEFEMRCRRYLDDNNAEAIDYDELNKMLDRR